MESKILSKLKKKLNNKLSVSASMLITSAFAVSLIYLLAACTTEDAVTAAAGTATAGIAGLMGIFICLYVLAFAVGIFTFVVWIIALVDCAKRENLEFPSPSDNTKVLWILIIVLAGGIGGIIYYFLVMKKMPRKK